MRRPLALAWSLVLFALPLTAETHPRGAILDPVRYAQAPQKARLTTRAYQELPPAVSLKAYAPEPRTQGPYGTCTAWATAYAARTITESKALGRTNRAETNRNVFSPAFVYKNISDDPDCNTGTAIIDALELMETQGVPKLPAFETIENFPRIPLTKYKDAPKFTIGGWAILFTWDEQAGADFRVQAVKKSLASGKVVVIGMDVPDSFDDAVGVWKPRAGEGEGGGHAMCVVGYDNSQYGGAFEIQNSWGTDWGNEGYIWVKYADFARAVNEAYELADDLTAPAALAFQSSVKVRLAGQAEPMGLRLTNDGQTYLSDRAYPSGTRFRLYLTNTEAAYVYTLASDSTGETTLLFPQNGQAASALLDYPGSEVSYPGEAQWIQMDQREGYDYVAVLYSKKPLDIEGIRRRVSSFQGTFLQQVAQAVGPSFVKADRGRYLSKEASFKATVAEKDAVFGLVLALQHGRN